MIFAEGLHLEICPSCNIQTGIFSEIPRHSLPKLLDSGVNISLNTDGRATNGASLSSEYQVVSDAFGWSDHIFLDLNRNALNASFASDRVKSSVNSQIDDYEAQL